MLSKLTIYYCDVCKKQIELLDDNAIHCPYCVLSDEKKKRYIKFNPGGDPVLLFNHVDVMDELIKEMEKEK